LHLQLPTREELPPGSASEGSAADGYETAVVDSERFTQNELVAAEWTPAAQKLSDQPCDNSARRQRRAVFVSKVCHVHANL
jgi:hypothetical protein